MIKISDKLQPIIEAKRAEITAHKKIRDIHEAIKKTKGLIIFAEIKRASPSKGVINTELDIPATLRTYEKNNVTAISILTDQHFQGTLDLLRLAKDGADAPTKHTPILRKDFIIDEYQIYESLYYGADIILLIASILTQEQLVLFVKIAHSIGLECLVETHNEEEIKKALATDAKLIGINARDLTTFMVDLQTIVRLAPKIPKDRIVIAESGIGSASDVVTVVKAGARGILVGTTLMEAGDIEAKIKEFRSAASEL